MNNLRAQRKAERVDRRRREAPYPKPPKEFWGKEHRRKQVEEVQARCQVCKKTEKDCIKEFGCGLTRDHWIPVRFITMHGLGDPHLDLNINMICSGCGGIKTQAEHMLFRGNNVGFVMHLRDFGFNMAELGMVMKFYRIYPATIGHVFR
jgi:5-methylcytosine-specific restriction endonuclease McrA